MRIYRFSTDFPIDENGNPNIYIHKIEFFTYIIYIIDECIELNVVMWTIFKIYMDVKGTFKLLGYWKRVHISTRLKGIFQFEKIINWL